AAQPLTYPIGGEMLRVLRTLSAHKVDSSAARPYDGRPQGRPRGSSWAPAAGAFLIVLGLLPLGGCGKGNANLPALAPVKGKVTVDGQTVTSGQVTLLPQAVEKGKDILPSAGQIDSSGNYEIFTGGQAGAPLGLAKLTVTPSMVPQEGAKEAPKTAYDARYSDANKTPLKYTVVEKAAPGT